MTFNYEHIAKPRRERHADTLFVPGGHEKYLACLKKREQAFRDYARRRGTKIITCLLLLIASAWADDNRNFYDIKTACEGLEQTDKFTKDEAISVSAVWIAVAINANSKCAESEKRMDDCILVEYTKIKNKPGYRDEAIKHINSICEAIYDANQTL